MYVDGVYSLNRDVLSGDLVSTYFRATIVVSQEALFLSCYKTSSVIEFVGARVVVGPQRCRIIVDMRLS